MVASLCLFKDFGIFPVSRGEAHAPVCNPGFWPWCSQRRELLGAHCGDLSLTAVPGGGGRTKQYLGCKTSA